MTTFPLPNITCEKVSNLSLRIYKANLATLNRFAITLLSEELSKGFNQRLGNCIETVLQSALSYAKENSMFEGGNQEVSVTQLQWLYFATYKIALKLIASSGLLWTTSVLDHSRDFALQYRQIAYPEMGSEAPRPHFFAVAYLRLLVSSLKARCEDDPTEKVPHYKDVRACFQHLNNLHGWKDGEEETDDDDANYKEDRHYDIAKFFDLEAAMHLKMWQDVASICASDEAFPGPKFHAPIMDLTLQLDLPPRLAISIIKRIVSKLKKLQDDPPTTWQRDFRVSLPHYLHCLFGLAIAPVQYTTSSGTASLDVEMADPEVAEEVLDEVLAMADKEAGVEESAHLQHGLHAIQAKSELGEVFTYPAVELMQIASMAFNKAADFYRATQDEDCQRWADKAIRISQLVPGAQGKQLVKALQNRLGSLIGV
ncbi:sporulation-specific protein 22 [Penicillium rubens]|nr:sporulation-specific protein 22 [Penicillium rubens]